jgi:hypothetical protein
VVGPAPALHKTNFHNATPVFPFFAIFRRRRSGWQHFETGRQIHAIDILIDSTRGIAACQLPGRERQFGPTIRPPALLERSNPRGDHLQFLKLMP